ncbi:LADA_0D12288g1_1 [Lachancea dasiensis]|uniref:LADA_0D12288g1_1 n=1 Tax=Lachancea dasiensis TaxID=1072105 RepID=A0A1G4J866_9SACH|nr:LADA_0D12288g1_1 [Lachancea dasiensis]
MKDGRAVYISFLCVGLVVTGAINSLFTKYQDNQCVRNCDTLSPVFFNQPVLQTLQMFLGEMTVLLAVRYQSQSSTPLDPTVGSKPMINGRQHLILSIPAICDIIASTFMNLALILTPVSIYQMTRGGIVFFVALFSVVFLKRKVSRLEWASLAVIVMGVAIVGYSGQEAVNFIDPEHYVDDAESLILGISLIVMGLGFMAMQFIAEEHIMSRWSVSPIRLVGFEGLFGTVITTGLLVIGHIVVGHNDIESGLNLRQALIDMFSEKKILLSSLAIMISIAAFNYFGISITKNVSATSRSTIDTCRTMLVWLVSLTLGWEPFKFMQLTGFILLAFGTLVFNDAIEIPSQYLPKFLLSDKKEEHERLINTIDEEIERF